MAKLKIKKIFTREVKNFANCFKESGFEAYAVGGCVRDMLMGEIPHDIDFCTNATPAEIIKVLEKNGYKYHELGIKFGTVVAHVGDKEIEITTYRSEINNDGRHCDVKFISSLQEDLARRDFTINAIAYDCIEDVIVDPFDGMEDLKHKMLKTVGDAKQRFSEDSLRVLRGLRFATKYQLDIDSDVYKQILHFINNGLIDNLSKERIQQELIKILSIPNLMRTDLDALNPLFFHIIPDLALQYGYDQNNKYHDYDLLTHTYKVVCLISQTATMFPTINLPLVRLAALLHDVGKPACATQGDDGQSHFYGHDKKSAEIAREFMKTYKFSNADTDFVVHLIEHHDAQYAGNNKRSVKKLIKKIGEDNMPAFFALTLADKKTHNMTYATDIYLNTISAINIYKELIDAGDVKMDSDCLAIDGHDIMKYFEIGPSKKVGVVMKIAAEAVDDGKVKNKKEDILHYVFHLFENAKEKSPLI